MPSDSRSNLSPEAALNARKLRIRETADRIKGIMINQFACYDWSSSAKDTFSSAAAVELACQELAAEGWIATAKGTTLEIHLPPALDAQD